MIVSSLSSYIDFCNHSELCKKQLRFFSLQIIANQRGKVKKKIVLFCKKNYGIFVKMLEVKLPYKAKENEKNDHLQKEADSLY